MLFPSRLMEAVWVFFLLVQFAGPAPVQESLVRLGRLPRMQGCYFKSDHFENGERIFTQESCLNCTCIDSTVMCYLRVCPFVKPLGEHCIEVKNEDDCCPTFHCPEVTKEKDCHDSTHNHDQPGCFLNDTYYPDGAMLPPDPNKPCEVCYCIRNSTSCVVQQCELNIEGCSPMYKPGQCCPCRYNCSYGVDSTTVPPGYTVEDLSDGCILADDRFIPDGEAVNSTNPCEHCYCMRNEVVCAIQECQAPGDNCKPLPVKQGQCCPDQYDCPSSNESSDSSISSTSNISTTDKVSLPKISKEASAVRPEEADQASNDSNMDNESVELTKHTETGETDYKIALEVVLEDNETSTEDTQTIVSVTDSSKDDEIAKTHPKVSDDDISKYDKVEIELILMTTDTDDIPEKYEKSTEITQPIDSVKDTPKDDKTSIEETPSTVSSKDISKDMEPISMENLPATDVSLHPEEAVLVKETATKGTDGVKLSPKGIIRKITPSEKVERPKFSQKGGFEEIPLYKPTPPPNMVNDYFPVSRTKDVIKATTMTPPAPPLVHNPYKLPNNILRIRGQNTTKVIPGVTAIYEHPRPSLGIKGGVFNITIPTGAYQGVKGSGYTFKGGIVYPNRHKPILPVGAIPGEKNQGSSIKLPGMSTIPGEGNCQVGKVTYRSGYKVPSSEPCKTNCHCIHGVVYCDRVICEPPPEQNCVIYHFARECCPHYQCDTLETVSETEEEKSQDEQPAVTPLLKDAKPLHTEHEKDFDTTTLILSSDIAKTTVTYEQSTLTTEAIKTTDYTTKETEDFQSSTIPDETVTKKHTQFTTQTGLSRETMFDKSPADKTTTQTSSEESDITVFTTSTSIESSSMVILETTATSSEQEENLASKTTVDTSLKTISEQTLESSASSTVVKEQTTLSNDYVTEKGTQSTEFTTDTFTNANVIHHSEEDQFKNLSSAPDIIIENTTILDYKTRTDSDITSSSSTVATIMSMEDLKLTTSVYEDVSHTDTLSSNTQLNDEELKITQTDSDTEIIHFENKDFTTLSELQESDTDTTINEASIITSESVEHGSVTTDFPKESSSFPTVRDSVTTESRNTDMQKDTHSIHTVTSKLPITKLKDYEELLPTTSVFPKQTMAPDVLLDENFSLQTTSDVYETSSPVKHSEELSEPVTTQETGLHSEDKKDFHITTSSLPVTTMTTEISKSQPTTIKESEKEKTHFYKTTVSPAVEYGNTEIDLVNETPEVIPNEYEIAGSDVTQTTLSKHTTTQETLKILDSNETEEHIVITAIPVQPTSTQLQDNDDTASPVIFFEEKNKIFNNNENEYLAPSKSTSITEMPSTELEESNKISSKPIENLENITFLHEKDNLSEETNFKTTKTSSSTEDSGGLRTSINKTLILGSTELSDEETIITDEPFGFTEATRRTPENLQEKDLGDLEKTETIPNILTSVHQTSEDLASKPSITEEKETTTYSSGKEDLVFTTFQGSKSSSTVEADSFESQSSTHKTINEGTTHLNQKDVSDADQTTPSSTASKVTTAEINKTTLPLTSSAESFEKLSTVHTTINEETTLLDKEDVSDKDGLQTSTISEITTFELTKTISPKTGTEEPSEPSSTVFTTINYGTILLHKDDVNAIYQIIPSLSDSKITTAEIPNKTLATSSAESSEKLSTEETTINETITSLREKDVSDGGETMPYTTVSTITTEKILKITSPPTSLSEFSEKKSTTHTTIEERTTILHQDVSRVDETIPHSTVSKITTAEIPEGTSPETDLGESSETLSTVHTTTNEGIIILHQEDSTNFDEITPSTVSKSTTAEIFKITSPVKSSDESPEELSTVDTTINKETTISNLEDISNGDETMPSSTVSKITTDEIPKITSTGTVFEDASEKLYTITTTNNERITFSDQKDTINLDETLPSSIPSKITTAETSSVTSLGTSLAESSEKLSTIHKTIYDGTTFLYQEDINDGDKSVPFSTGLKITTTQVPYTASLGTGSAESYEKKPTTTTVIHKETTILDQEDASSVDETIPTSLPSKIATAEFLETTLKGMGSTEASDSLSTVRTTSKDETTILYEGVSDGDEIELPSTVLKFTTTNITKMSSPVTDSTESSEKLPTAMTAINERTTFLPQKDASEIIKFDKEVSATTPEAGDSVDSTEMSSDSIYEKKFIQKATTNEDKNEVEDHENTKDVSSVPNITTAFITYTEITKVPDTSLETEKTEKPSSFMAASPELLVFSEAKTTQYPKNTITMSLQTTFEPETSSHYHEKITTSTTSSDSRTSDHDINIQHVENQEEHITTFSTIKETEQDILSSIDNNISQFNYTSMTDDINENFTITVPQTHFTENYSEIKNTEDISHTENWSSQNVSVVTTRTPDIISRIKPQHLSESTLDKDTISANTDTKIQTTVVSTEKDTGASTDQFSEIYDTKIKTQTSKYPLLISEELHEYESNEIKDQSLIGHKIKAAEKDIASMFVESPNMEGIPQIHHSTSTSHEPQNVAHTTIKEFLDMKSEIPTTSSTASSLKPIDVSSQEFSTAFTVSEETTKTPLKTEITTSAEDSSFYDFSTHDDTIIERETLPPITMQSPESLVSHSESVQEKLSTLSSIKTTFSTPIDKETSTPFTVITTDQETRKSTILDPRNFTTKIILEETTLSTLSQDKGLETQTSTTNISGLKIQPQGSESEFISYKTTEKSPVSATELTEEIDLPGTIITRMPVEFLESESKVPEALEVNTPDTVNQELPSSTYSHSVTESTQHYLPTTTDNLFESNKTESTEEFETGVISKSSLPYPEYIINKSDISTAEHAFTEESTISQETLVTGGSTKDIHYETGVESIKSSQDPEFIVNKSDISIGKPDFSKESTIYKETLVTDGTTKEIHYETKDSYVNYEAESTSSQLYPKYIVNKSDISTEKPGFVEESTIAKEMMSTDGTTKDFPYETEVESTSSSSLYPEYNVNKSYISTEKSGFTEESIKAKQTLVTDGSTKDIPYETEEELTSSSSLHPEYIISKSDTSTEKPGFTEESTIAKETIDIDGSTKDIHYEAKFSTPSSLPHLEFAVNKSNISPGKLDFTEQSTVPKETLSVDGSTKAASMATYGITKDTYSETAVESTSLPPYTEYIVNKFDISARKPGFIEESTIPNETLSTDESTKEIQYKNELESKSSTQYPEYTVNKFDISTEKPGFTEKSTISEETLSTDGTTKGVHYESEVESTSSTPYPEYIINKSDISTGKTEFPEKSTISEEMLATGESNEEIHIVTNIESKSSSLYPEFKVNDSSVTTRKPEFTEDITIPIEILATKQDALADIYISSAEPLSFDSKNATDSFSTNKQSEIILVNQSDQSFSLEDINSETMDINPYTKPDKIISSTIANQSGFTDDSLLIHFTKDIIFDSTITSKHTESTTFKTQEKQSTTPDLTTLITQTSLHDVTTQEPSHLTIKYITTTADYVSSIKEIVKDTTITPPIVKEQSTTEEVITIKPENATIVDMTTASIIHNVGVKLGSNDVFDILTDINKDNEIVNGLLNIGDTASNTDDPSMLKNVSEITVTSFSTDEIHTRPSANLQTEFSDITETELTDLPLSETFVKDSETTQTKERDYSTLTWLTENKSSSSRSTITESQDKETTAFSINVDYSTASTPSSNIDYVSLTSDASFSVETQNISSTDIFKKDNLSTFTESLSDLSSAQDENVSDTELIPLDHQSTLKDDKETTTSQITHVGNLTEMQQSFTTTSPENIIYNITSKREYESNATPTTILKKAEEKTSTMSDLTTLSTQTEFAEQTTLPNKEEIDFSISILIIEDQPLDDSINATEIEISSNHSTPTSISTKDEIYDDETNASKDLEILSTRTTVIPKDQVVNENESITGDLIKKTSIAPEKDIKYDNQAVTDLFTSTIHTDDGIPVTSEKFDSKKSNHSALPGASSGWMTHPLEDNIVKALSTIFPSNPDTMVYETHSSFPSGTTVYGTHVNQESGVCYFEGKVYLSSEQIPREDNCEFCFCFKGDIICLQQTCPPPISGCYSIPIDGFCCPRFHCPVQQMWFGLPSSTTTTPSPPLGKSPHRQYPTPGCQIEGKSYRLHQIVQRSSNPCMLCRCDYGGIMKCEPRSCKPGPPMIQEIAEAFFRRR